MARKQVGLSGELVDQIDTVAAAVGQSRTEWVEHAVRERLDQPRSRQRMGVALGPEQMARMERPARPPVSGKRNVRPAYPKAGKR